MSDTSSTALIIVGAYFLGAIPWGLLLARRRGLDIRTVGSGNIGATNVARNLGKKVGAVVLLLDALKGALPVIAIETLGADRLMGQPFLLTFVGLAAILGHCFPIWLRFRGGKGVATSLGVFLVADPLLAFVGVALFAAIYGVFRVASIGSIAAALSFPVLGWVLDRPTPLLMLCAGGAAIVIVKHYANIVRLLRRTELKV